MTPAAKNGALMLAGAAALAFAVYRQSVPIGTHGLERPSAEPTPPPAEREDEQPTWDEPALIERTPEQLEAKPAPEPPAIATREPESRPPTRPAARPQAPSPATPPGPLRLPEKFRHIESLYEHSTDCELQRYYAPFLSAGFTQAKLENGRLVWGRAPQPGPFSFVWLRSVCFKPENWECLLDIATDSRNDRVHWPLPRSAADADDAHERVNLFARMWGIWSEGGGFAPCWGQPQAQAQPGFHTGEPIWNYLNPHNPLPR